MPNEKQRSEIKVTDKRMFTAEGDIREEFAGKIQAAEPMASAPRAAETAATKPSEKEKQAERERRVQDQGAPPETGERRHTIAEKGSNPGSAFTNFIEPLIAQAYMSLGMLRNPYQPQTKTDPGAARQMIEILGLLKEKTQGNLTLDEEEFLTAHLGELKLAYVQRTKSI